MTEFVWDWEYAWSVVPFLLKGLKITFFATILGSIGAFILGLVWTFIRMARIPVVSPVAEFIVHFVRGTPFLVQLYFLFFVLPSWGVVIPPLTTGVIALALFNSVYVAEIYRAGIENIPSGQWEAAQTLGLPIRRVWFGIILPQAVRTILPVLGNQVIAMFKETAQLSTITIFELMAAARDISSINFRFVEPLTMAGVCYFVLSYTSARIVRKWENRNAVGS
jgi:polar amino acid transport system permease protein